MVVGISLLVMVLFIEDMVVGRLSVLVVDSFIEDMIGHSIAELFSSGKYVLIRNINNPSSIDMLTHSSSL